MAFCVIPAPAQVYKLPVFVLGYILFTSVPYPTHAGRHKGAEQAKGDDFVGESGANFSIARSGA